MQCVENFALHQFFAILGNSKIFSAMAMAMSIYRTLCVLVFTRLRFMEFSARFWSRFPRLTAVALGVPVYFQTTPALLNSGTKYSSILETREVLKDSKYQSRAF